MSRLAAGSRADLLRELRDGRLSPDTAALYHFAPVASPPASHLPEGWEPAPADAPLPEAKLPRPPVIKFPRQRPRLNFLRAETAESLAPLPPPPADNPIREEELKVPWGRPGVPLRPLMRWSRLAGWLRRRLGAQIPGSVLDLRSLLRLVTRGHPVLELPRRCRPVWAAQALVLWDDTKEQRPFQPDLRWLERRLERERGRHGLRVLRLRGLPRAREFAPLPPGCPVLALSAMGQFTGDALTQAAWLALGRRLNWQGHPLQAFSPCPRRQWASALAAVWPMAVWDQQARLPRLAGSRPAPVPAPEPAQAIEDLLDLLAPAARVSPELLRAARLVLGGSADAGTEWQAWSHAAGWNSLDCFGFKTGPELAARLNRRQAWTGPRAEAAAQVAPLLRLDHAPHSPALGWETDLRLAFTQPAGDEVPSHHLSPEDQSLLTSAPTAAEGDFGPLGEFLQRVVDRLRRLVAEGRPLSTQRRTDELAPGLRRVVATLTPEMRAHPAVAALLAQGLALADTLERPEQVEIASGIDLAAYAAETRALPGRRFAEAAPWHVELAPDGEGTRFVLRPQTDTPATRRVPLAQLPVAPGPLLVEVEPQPSTRFQLSEGHPSVELPLSAARRVEVISTHGRLTVQPFIRPAWARRLWQDRFGLAAEFTVNGVPFVLRWIPPGRFLMGSPADELGRWDDEGPQHEVTITRGFWLGETPVTQAQWRAAVEGDYAHNMLSAIARLQIGEMKRGVPPQDRPDDAPVTAVDWPNAQKYCRLLNAHLFEGPGFHLPSEAQWEYACRAGTTGAFHDGSGCSEPEGKDPALDQLAWFGANSDGRIHPVKQKQANDWGLYDMHGNVCEWCADPWGNYTAEAQRDPFRDGTSYAPRVVRGGSWGDQARDCRAAIRHVWHPRYRLPDLSQGLRLAAGLELQAAEPRGAERPPGRRGEAAAEGRSPEASARSGAKGGK